MKIPSFSGPLGAGSSNKGWIVHREQPSGESTGGLSVFFTTLCIVDLFGVFPIVALPKSVIDCGIYSIPLVASVFALQIYTAILLGRSWLLAQELSPSIKEKHRYPYAAVAELAFGTPARRLVTFLINAAIFGAGVPNYIFAAQSMQIFWWKITGGDVGVSYCVWMVLIGLLLCPVMWLGSPKDMKPIAILSVSIVITVAVSTWVCIYTDVESPPASDILHYQPEFKDFLVAYGIIAFQFDIHPMLLTLQVDMREGRKVPRAVLGGFLATGALFTTTSILAAARYGSQVQNNILHGMPPSITLYIVALLVTLQLCLSSAVGTSPLFQQIEDLLRIPKVFGYKRCLIRSSIVILAVFLGESVPRFDVVMGFIGSTLTGPLMFIFPPLFFLKLSYVKSRQIKETRLLLNEAVDVGKPLHSSKQNGRRAQNGDDLSHFPLIYNDALQPDYNTFRSRYEIYLDRGEYNVKWYDAIFAVVIMLLGVASTIVATYSSGMDAISSATFTPPCLVNSTAAARSFILNMQEDF